MKKFIKNLLAVLSYIPMLALIVVAFYASYACFHLTGKLIFVMGFTGLFTALFLSYVWIKNVVQEIQYFIYRRKHLKTFVAGKAIK